MSEYFAIYLIAIQKWKIDTANKQFWLLRKELIFCHRIAFITFSQILHEENFVQSSIFAPNLYKSYVRISLF